MTTKNLYDFIGIGAGPSNLSLAALSSKHPKIKTIFLEKQNEFQWHPGLLLPNTKVLVSALEDLVTLVDPTNYYSFLNYLFLNRRLYQFVISPASRVEFNKYFNWAFNNLKSIAKNQNVKEINFKNNKLEIITNENQKFFTKNLVLGTGLVPVIPNFCKRYIGVDIFHSNEFLFRKTSFKGLKIGIIGSGQSSAEIMQHIIESDMELPKSIYWITKQKNFEILDNSFFTVEFLNPPYLNFFYKLPLEKKHKLLYEQNLVNNGISRDTLKEIYKRLYELKYIKNLNNFHLFPSHEFKKIQKNNSAHTIILKNIITDELKKIHLDKIILCTGYKYELPDFMTNIKDLLYKDKYGLKITKEYKLKWKGESKCSIYIQNGAQHTHGISDPNLSLIAYRSATILNDIAGKTLYPNITGSSMIDWE